MANAMTGEGLASWLDQEIKEFVAGSTGNSMREGGDERMWALPLVGFSRGDDPLYRQLKEDIGSFYWTPEEAFADTFPEDSVSSDSLTVISWVLPQTELTKADNRLQRKYPSERWSRTRLFGEAFNDSLRRHIVEVLKVVGIAASAPILSPNWRGQMSERYGFASNWSERHAAHVSGLGTFGLCDGLITPIGKAMRCGSVVARASVPPTERPYADHHAYCLFYARGICGKCIKRCPAGAITKEGHDKGKCGGYLGGVLLPYIRENYGIDIYSCGLCQTRVPCESGIPLKQ